MEMVKKFREKGEPWFRSGTLRQVCVSVGLGRRRRESSRCCRQPAARGLRTEQRGRALGRFVVPFACVI